jgi:GTP-binding protein EngB required for normal cell division
LDLDLPIIIVLSKIDKLSGSEVEKSLEYTRKIFFWQEIIGVSSAKKNWIKELVSSIKKALV